MNDMSAVIVPKSDQMNADDLLAGPITITIRDVSIRPGTEQPVSIHFDGDNNKPYKPCKSMARVMVHCWGADASKYAGRSMTLYCDPKVQWGGMAVGGIRISHISDISDTTVMALTATKGSKKPFTVRPLVVEQKPKGRTWATILDEIEALFHAAQTPNAVDAVLASADVQKAMDKAQGASKARLDAIIKAATDRTRAPADDVFPGDLPPITGEERVGG